MKTYTHSVEYLYFQLKKRCLIKFHIILFIFQYFIIVKLLQLIILLIFISIFFQNYKIIELFILKYFEPHLLNSFYDTSHYLLIEIFFILKPCLFKKLLQNISNVSINFFHHQNLLKIKPKYLALVAISSLCYFMMFLIIDYFIFLFFFQFYNHQNYILFFQFHFILTKQKQVHYSIYYKVLFENLYLKNIYTRKKNIKCVCN